MRQWRICSRRTNRPKQASLLAPIEVAEQSPGVTYASLPIADWQAAATSRSGTASEPHPRCVQEPLPHNVLPRRRRGSSSPSPSETAPEPHPRCVREPYSTPPPPAGSLSRLAATAPSRREPLRLTGDCAGARRAGDRRSPLHDTRWPTARLSCHLYLTSCA